MDEKCCSWEEATICHFNLIPFLGCDHKDMTAVSGDTLNPSFSVERLLTRHDKETWGGGNGPATFWLGPNHKPATFILNLGCSQTFKGIELVNTHTGTYKDRGTKQFRYKDQYLHF